MNKFRADIIVTADDIIEAELIKDGLQNALNELGQEQKIFARFADPNEAKRYAAKIRQLINSPLMNQLSKVFGG